MTTNAQCCNSGAINVKSKYPQQNAIKNNCKIY